MPRPATVSPDRILAAAATEFAERGYAGARVDRIAARARVNKAMLYYHFGSKRELYRSLLRQVFSHVADRLQPIIAADGPADSKLTQFVAVMAGLISEHAFFPAIMMREVADGGAHLDQATLAALARIPATVGAIVQQGIADRTVREMHPIAAYFMMFAPIVMFLAGAPILKALAARGLANISALTPAVFVEQLQQTIRLAFEARATAPSSSRPRRPRPRPSSRRKRL